ncbi:hypothetical protein SBE55_14095 [Mycolicibacterium sp. 141076]|uniref:hypothetical protein n=1 Tax=Mycolicibacterium sp. 141076 TaxID=3090599 RepID=UPI00299F442A|nr:hypothetical protein [Mycolicibacterium sp. 141076]MDX1878946.1 hypothetical protein [Mycolicibacterium sp. 141076]
MTASDDLTGENDLRSLGFPEDTLSLAITALPTPGVARQWVEILGPRAFVKRLLKAIPATGFDAEDYLRWREAGLDDHAALDLPPKLADAGWGPEDYRRWRAAGFTAEDLTKLSRYLTADFSIDNVFSTLERWLGPGETSGYGAVYEFTEVLRSKRAHADLARLVTSGFSGHEIYTWCSTGITDTAWIEWKQAGFAAWHAGQFARLGIPPGTARQCSDAGLRADDVEPFLTSGMLLDEACDWAQAGVDVDDVDDFTELGLGPSEAVVYAKDGIRPHQITRTETGYDVELEPWQEDPLDQLPKVIEPGDINLRLWSSTQYDDEPVECAVWLHWGGTHTIEWSVVSGIGMSMMSEVSFSGIAGWPDGKNVELCYTRDCNERGVDWLAGAAPTAQDPNGSKDPRQWLALASSLVDLTDGLLDSGVESIDEYTSDYHDPANRESLNFNEMFAKFLTTAGAEGKRPEFYDWLTAALEKGAYTQA